VEKSATPNSHKKCTKRHVTLSTATWQGPARISAASGGTPRRPPRSLSLYKRTHPLLELGGQARFQFQQPRRQLVQVSTSIHIRNGADSEQRRNQTKCPSPMSPSELGTYPDLNSYLPQRKWSCIIIITSSNSTLVLLTASHSHLGWA
jgi:hypothetical protein